MSAEPVIIMANFNTRQAAGRASIPQALAIASLAAPVQQKKVLGVTFDAMDNFQLEELSKKDGL